MTQIEKEIRATIGVDANQIRAIGLSATPFELHALQRVWTVFQRLDPSYRGFNDFGGRTIDPTVRIQPPDTLSVSSAGLRFGIPFLPRVNPTAYSLYRSFCSWSRKIGYRGTWLQYQQDCVAAIRELIVALVKHGREKGENVGICLRAINDNDRTERLLNDLGLPPNFIEVVSLFWKRGQGVICKTGRRKTCEPESPLSLYGDIKGPNGRSVPEGCAVFY